VRSAASMVQPNQEKSTVQKATDAVSGSTTNKEAA
jgi:hypothetical protein